MSSYLSSQLRICLLFTLSLNPCYKLNIFLIIPCSLLGWNTPKDHLEVPGPQFDSHRSGRPSRVSVSKRCAPNWLEPGRRIAFHTLLKYSPGRA